MSAASQLLGETVSSPHAILRNGWWQPLVLLGATWVIPSFFHAAWMFIPLATIGAFAMVRRSPGIALLALLSPAPVNLALGMGSWFTNHPAFVFVGLPSATAENLDPSTRCFHSSGGCLSAGGDSLVLGPGNFGLRTMVQYFGPPPHTYHGAYPDELEAERVTTDALPTTVTEFNAGSLRLGTNQIQIPVGLAQAMAAEVPLWPYDEEDIDKSTVQIRAALYRDHCLLIRLTCRSKDGTRFPALESRRFVDCIYLANSADQHVFARFPLRGLVPRVSQVMNDRWRRD